MSECPRLCVVTQRAGPLTKTYTTDRTSRVGWAARQQCRGSPSSDPMIWGKSEQKLELYLALFGFSGAHYVLTFRDADLPRDFDGAKRRLAAFVRRVRRRYPEVRRYVYGVEAGHEHDRGMHGCAILREAEAYIRGGRTESSAPTRENRKAADCHGGGRYPKGTCSASLHCARRPVPTEGDRSTRVGVGDPARPMGREGQAPKTERS